MKGIYKITNPKGYIYIGQSVDIDKRFDKYRRLDCKNQTMLYRSLYKYGFENHIFDIITIGDFNKELLDELEIHYIRVYNSNMNGLNLTSGGRGNTNRKLTDKQKESVRKSRTGNKHTEETKKKISEFHKGNKWAIGNKSMLGKKIPTKVKLKMSLSKMDDRNINSKVVIDITTGVFYYSISSAAKAYNYNYHTLRSMLSNKNTNKSNLKKI